MAPSARKAHKAHAYEETTSRTVQVGLRAVEMLRNISEATTAPYLRAIAGVSELIFSTVDVSAPLESFILRC